MNKPSTDAASPRNGRGYALVLLAASLWSTLGVIYKYLINGFGVAPLSAAALRAAIAALILLLALIARGENLRIARRDWLLFLAFGTLGIAAFFTVYVYAVNLTGVAMAAVLLYTAPAWVALMAWRWLGEKLDRVGATALILALLGTALVAKIYDPEQLRVNWLGLLFALASGLTYALYSIFTKELVKRYRPWVVQLYGLLIGALCLLVIAPHANMPRAFASPVSVMLLLAMGVVPTLLASLAFSIGVQWVPVSIASIVATLELAVATLLGYLLFGERLALWQWIGAAAILVAVILLRPKPSRVQSGGSAPASLS